MLRTEPSIVNISSNQPRRESTTSRSGMYEAEMADSAPPLLLRHYIREMRVTHKQVKMCRAQCRLMYRRMSIIHEVLLKLPKNVPSPGLLSSFRDACFILTKMIVKEDEAASHAISQQDSPTGAQQPSPPPNWLFMLRQRFTCATIFNSFRDRLRKVWSLQPTTSWEAEDHKAQLEDEEEALQVLVEHAQVFAGTPMALPMARNAAEGTSSTFKSGDGSHNSAVVDIEQLRRIMRRAASSSGWKVDPNDVWLPSNSLYKFEHEALLRKLRKESGEADADRDSDMQSLAIGGSGSGSADLVDHSALQQRFAVNLNGTLQTVPFVVLKELNTTNGPLSSVTMEGFVLDVTVRRGWCQPNLVDFMGGFAERLTEELDDASGKLVLGAIPTLGAIMEQLPTAACLERRKSTNPNQTASAISSAGLLSPSGQVSSIPSGWQSSKRLYTSLHDLLFVHRTSFTLTEIIDIARQVAEAVQYITFDAENVTNETVFVWQATTPSNIYLREVHAEAAETQERDKLRKTTYDVRVSPRFYVEGGPANRWDPPFDALSPAAYSIGQLVICMITLQPPYNRAESQLELQALLRAPARVVGSSQDTHASSGTQPRMAVDVPHSNSMGSLQREMSELLVGGGVAATRQQQPQQQVASASYLGMVGQSLSAAAFGAQAQSGVYISHGVLPKGVEVPIGLPSYALELLLNRCLLRKSDFVGQGVELSGHQDALRSGKVLLLELRQSLNDLFHTSDGFIFDVLNPASPSEDFSSLDSHPFGGNETESVLGRPKADRRRKLLEYGTETDTSADGFDYHTA